MVYASIEYQDSTNKKKLRLWCDWTVGLSWLTPLRFLVFFFLCCFSWIWMTLTIESSFHWPLGLSIKASGCEKIIFLLIIQHVCCCWSFLSIHSLNVFFIVKRSLQSFFTGVRISPCKNWLRRSRMAAHRRTATGVAMVVLILGHGLMTWIIVWGSHHFRKPYSFSLVAIRTM